MLNVCWLFGGSGRITGGFCSIVVDCVDSNRFFVDFGGLLVVLGVLVDLSWILVDVGGFCRISNGFEMDFNGLLVDFGRFCLF